MPRAPDSPPALPALAAALLLAVVLAAVPALLHALRGEPARAAPRSELVTPPAPPPADVTTPPATPDASSTWTPVIWRSSRAVGLPYAGRLVRGVQLPDEGQDFFTWDPILKKSPSRGWRRWATDDLLRMVLTVIAEYRADNPGAPRVTIGDLSRPRGGEFGPRFGGLGHKSHQNGLDVDIYYPRRDRLERQAIRRSQIDTALAQDLVDRFVEAGAVYVFVGLRTKLRGPRKIVQKLVHHDDHMHVRIPKR